MVTLLTGVLFLFYAGSRGQTPPGAYNSPSLGGGSTSPGGATTQIQYNNAGTFGGVGGFLFVNGTGALSYTPPVSGGSFHVLNNGSNTDSFAVINGGSGRTELRVDLGVSNQTFVGNSLDGGTLVIGGPAIAGNLNLGNTSSHIIAQAAPGDLAGTLACAASTATKTFTTAYTSTPTILVFDETTKGGVNLTAKSNTAFTVSCTGATDALDYIVIGNPN
jgi:hypothetical protein